MSPKFSAVQAEAAQEDKFKEELQAKERELEELKLRLELAEKQKKLEEQKRLVSHRSFL